MTDISSSQTNVPPPVKPQRWYGWLVGLILLLLGMILACVWLSATEAGFAVSWQIAERLTSGAVVTTKVRGTLWQGFSLEGVRYQDDEVHVDIQHIAVDWRPSALFSQYALIVKKLAIGHVRIKRLRPSSSSPIKEPLSLALPLNIHINHLSLASLVIEPTLLYLYGIEASYHYDVGRRHAFRLVSLRSPWGKGSAYLNVAEAKPFVLRGEAQLDGLLDKVPFDAALGVSGPMRSFSLQGSMGSPHLAAHIQGQFAPFAANSYGWVKRLDVRAGGVNPKAFSSTFPSARLNVALRVEPIANNTLQGGLSLINLVPGNLNKESLPVKSLFAEFQVKNEELSLSSVKASLIQGEVGIVGRLSLRHLDLRATLTGVNLPALHAALTDDTVAGHMYLNGTPAMPRLALDIEGKHLSGAMQLAMSSAPKRQLMLTQFRLAAGMGKVEAQGHVDLDVPRTFNVKGMLHHFNPVHISPRWPSGDINATIKAHGQLNKGQTIRVAAQIMKSQLSGAPLEGQLEGAWVTERLSQVRTHLLLGKNRLWMEGAFGAPGDRLLVKVNAPELRLIGLGFSGQIQGAMEVIGSWSHPAIKADFKAEQLILPDIVSARTFTLEAFIAAEAAAPCRLQLTGADIHHGSVWIKTLRMSTEGTRSRHRIRLEAKAHVLQASWVVAFGASGGFDTPLRYWNGLIEQFEAEGPVPMTLLAPTLFQVGANGVTLGALNARVLNGTLSSTNVTRINNTEIVTQGKLSHFNIDSVVGLFSIPIEQNVVLDADWAVRWGSKPAGKFTLRRVSGDVTIPATDTVPSIPLGMRELLANIDLSAGQTVFTVVLDSLRATVRGQGNVVYGGRGLDARSPLSGTFQVHLPALGPFASYAGSSFDVAGQLSLDMAVNGALGAPQFQGNIEGQGIKLADRRTGIRLVNGALSARIIDRQLELTQLRFTDGVGEISAQGSLNLRNDGPDARVKVILKTFSVFDRPSRRLVVSGNAELAFVNQAISLTGQLRADKGRIELVRMGTPVLSDDVVIKGQEPPEPSALSRLPLTVSMTLDLGEQFRFTGRGLDVVLMGQAQLTSQPGMAPAARGQVRVVQGRYKAYGQDLDITYGVVSFVGPLDNPSLNIRAVRRLSPVGAGVEVTGTVMVPNVRLIANEPMTEKDKLAWLVLGRAASVSGSDDLSIAAATSAGTLLAGSINDHIGIFDDLGMTQRGERVLVNGSVSPAEQVVMVGKRLTQELYLGYEYGVTSAYQAVKFMYQLSRNWSLVLRAGTEASAETRYTVRFD